MKITPTYNYLLVRMHDVPSKSGIKLPQGLQRQPYGEVVEAGPDCKVCKVGDLILFRPDNYVAGFDQGGDERFVIPEPAVFAFCDPVISQSGHTEPKILKTPEDNNNADH